MNAVSHHVTPELARLLSQTAALARAQTAFLEVQDTGSMVACQCAAQPDAWYRIESDGGRLTVNWVSSDRYLSQSIEAELMWTGDSMDELIDEERVDQGFERGPLGDVEHYRNEEKLFTFRSAIPMDLGAIDVDRDATELVKCLLAYAAAFAELGDMKPGEDN